MMQLKLGCLGLVGNPMIPIEKPSMAIISNAWGGLKTFIAAEEDKNVYILLAWV
jgi:hypothetical protein